MLWLKSFHIIAMVCWFAGLFYLPRLFVYHSDAQDDLSKTRFITMERRLYYGIMFPAMVLTIVFGIWMITYNPGFYLGAIWLHTKLTLVLLLVIFHGYCGHTIKKLAANTCQHRPRFYRLINEIPTILLVSIVILVVVKPGF